MDANLIGLLAMAGIAIVTAIGLTIGVKRDRFGLAAASLIAGIFLVGAIGITMSARQTGNFSDDCVEAGGHVYINKGTWLCLADDGRVIQP